MFDFSSFLNLPLIFGFIIGFAIFMYVLLDGFDLGIGILFPFAPTHACRNKMMNSIAPFWDGNETWLVLGGGGLFAAFPLAYALIMPAFYIPIILMLLGLIFRGVAFEFRFKAESKTEQKIWDYSFFSGSLIATFFQGVMLGAFVEGLIFGRENYLGSAFSWFSAFSITTGVALIFGYALLGSTWLIMKSDGQTQSWARNVAVYALIFVGLFIAIVSLWTPLLNEKIFLRWFLVPNIFYLLEVPLLTIFAFIYLGKSLKAQKEKAPFFAAIAIFALCYFGLAVSLFPYVVPYQITFQQAAASTKSLSFLLVGVAITLPVILIYTAYAYHVFRGKATHEKMY
jgi:cytochrome bd ubiquinol oxidase subunit II